MFVLRKATNILVFDSIILDLNFVVVIAFFNVLFDGEMFP